MSAASALAKREPTAAAATATAIGPRGMLNSPDAPRLLGTARSSSTGPSGHGATANGGPPTADMDGSVGGPCVQGGRPGPRAAERRSEAPSFAKISGNFGPLAAERRSNGRPQPDGPAASSSSVASPGGGQPGRRRRADAGGSLREPSRRQGAARSRRADASARAEPRSRPARAKGGLRGAGTASAPAVRRRLERRRRASGSTTARRSRATEEAGARATRSARAPARHGRHAGSRTSSTPLDPLARHVAHLAPPAMSAPVDHVSAAGERAGSRALARGAAPRARATDRVGRRSPQGTVRLELGAGAYAGTTVTVHADGGRVRVELGGMRGPRARSATRPPRRAPPRSRARRRERDVGLLLRGHEAGDRRIRASSPDEAVEHVVGELRAARAAGR